MSENQNTSTTPEKAVVPIASEDQTTPIAQTASVPIQLTQAPIIKTPTQKK